jgi:hypothetical protein
MGGSRWFWLVSVLLAAAAAACLALLLHRYQRTETVVVARVAVPPWSLVTATDLARVRRPAAGLLPATLLAPSVVVGRFTVTGLVPGQAVTAANLSWSGLGSAYDAQLAALDGITRHCGSGTRAIAVPTTGGTPAAVTHPTCGRYEALAVPLDANAGYDLVHAGSRIDLWATYPTPSGEVAQAIVTGVLVMARFAPGSSAPVVGASSSTVAQTATTGIVVLAVTPGQAGRILLAGRLGQIAAVLEPIGGEGRGSPSPVTLTSLLGGPPAQSVAPTSGGVLPATSGPGAG